MKMQGLHKVLSLQDSSRWGAGNQDCTVIHFSSDEIVHVSTETVDEENRVREDHRAAVEPTTPSLPPTKPTAPLNPCEGLKHTS